jgi:formate-dependent nitrite reductase cytochrome c552 subunit
MNASVKPRAGIRMFLGLALAIPLVWSLMGTAGCPFFAPPPGNDPNNPPGAGNSGVTGKYVGAETCKQCHANIHSAWSETLHAGALVTLENIGQGSNANCIGCHTVGFGEEGGFVDRATTNALAGVQCENCHGPGKDHVMNVSDATLRPKIDISASVCGKCHTGSHHPNFEQWGSSGHAEVVSSLVTSFSNGTNLNNCGTCHSGDFRYLAVYSGKTVPDDFLKGKTSEEMNGITCAICHNPHMRTGNAPFADEGRDYQLRFREIASPVASNTVEDTTNKERFNLCGQCHHERGRTWKDTARPVHHSLQSNMYVGEAAVPQNPDGTVTPLVPSQTSPHFSVQEQCATCHMYRQDFGSEEAPAISGHNFTVNYAGCVSASGCHPTAENAETRKTVLRTQIETLLGEIKTKLDTDYPANGWEYTSNGGPPSGGQGAIPDNVKKARFIYYYVLFDGSYGMHNAPYARALLNEAKAQLGI